MRRNVYMQKKREFGVKLAEEGDLKSAEVIISDLAKKGDVDALNDLGVVFEKQCKYKKAFACYVQAAVLGSVTAIYNIGHMLERGLGVEIDVAKAMQHYARAMDLGYPEAFYKMAMLLDRYGEHEDKEIIELLEKGSDLEKNFKGLYSCSAELGCRYEFGKGVEENIDKALEYYEKAASKGCTLAMFNAGLKYLGREGYTEKGIEYLTKAAELGYPDACAELAIAYYNGDVVEKDIALSMYYLNQGRKLNSPRARLYYIDFGLSGDINVSKEELENELKTFLSHEWANNYDWLYGQIKEGHKDGLDWEKIENNHLLNDYDNDYDDRDEYYDCSDSKYWG